MGLTHYWERPTELPKKPFAAAVEDLRRLIAGAGAELAGFDGTGSPICETEHVVFNGADGESCEPFEIRRIEFDRRGRPNVCSFCKSEGLPYDLFVRVALIVFRQHLGSQFEVRSDGNPDSWLQATALVQRVLGYGAGFRPAQGR